MAKQFNYDSAEQFERVQTVVYEIRARIKYGEPLVKALQNITFLEDLTSVERMMVLQHLEDDKGEKKNV